MQHDLVVLLEIVYQSASNLGWSDGRVAEGTGLLNLHRVYSPIEGSNPSRSAIEAPVSTRSISQLRSSLKAPRLLLTRATRHAKASLKKSTKA